MQIKSIVKFTLFIFLLPAALFAQEVKVDIPVLLKEAKVKSDENWRKVIAEHPNYTYKWRKSWRKSDAKGGVTERSELYEVFFPAKCPPKKCGRANVLLATDGKPLTPEKIDKQRIEAGRQIEKIENKAGARVHLPGPDQPLYWMYFGFYRRGLFETEQKLITAINGQEILETCEFFSPAREIINGRETIVLNFRPRPGAVFSEHTKYMPQAEGKFWIDAADKIFIGLAIWQKGTKFECATNDCILARSALVRDMARTTEGLWFPHFARINGLDNPALLTGMGTDFSIVQFDHHYFKTEVKGVEIKAAAEK